ncbi:hypothetical protein LIER_22475 [Lithospermum erythrorhizon]|uniref:Protein-serine/threonine phosphatase n=1 Tax=Lithospermum erythrorhizon TaxID=34254 RepID=A0AAV3QU93_LITER
MEDQSQVEAGQKATIVGVYDGHGGPQSSKYLCGKLLDYLLSYKPGTKDFDPKTILQDIEKQTTLEAEMTCLTHQPGRLIWEIRFCLDKRGGAFVNCNEPRQYNTYNCDNTKLKGIIFPKSTSIPPPPPPKSPPPPPPKSRSPPSNVSTSTSRIPSTSTSTSN